MVGVGCEAAKGTKLRMEEGEGEEGRAKEEKMGLWGRYYNVAWRGWVGYMYVK
jgi:hypothetical protein